MTETYVYVCLESKGFMDSEKGRVMKVFSDKEEAKEYAAKMMCYIEK